MTGERWQWFRVAHHLKIPVTELKSRLGYEEFLDWITFLRTAETEREAKFEYYLAQIATEICRGRVLYPNKVKLSDFYARFKTDEEIETERSQEQYLCHSKMAWGALVNLKLN